MARRGPGKFSSTRAGGKRVMGGPTGPGRQGVGNAAAVRRNETGGPASRKSPRIA
jgi:hypothetical protein